MTETGARSPSGSGLGARLAWWLIGGLALLSVCRTVVLAYDLARPMPYWDAWEFMKSLPAISAGRYRLADLLSFHNEHRIVTTRLLMLLDLRFFAASGYLPSAMTIIVLGAIGTLLALIVVGRNAIGAVMALVITSLLLSVAQADNFASGFQVQFPLVDLFAMLAIGGFVLVARARNPALLIVGTIAADALAIGTMASGNTVLVPIILVALALRAAVGRTLFVAVPALALTAAYVVGFPKPPIPPSHDIVEVSHFAVDYLGSTLRGYPRAPLALGTVLVLAYGMVLAHIVRGWVRRDALDPVLVWLAGLGAFLISGGVVTGVGRLSLGMETSISSRYAIQSLLFLGCVVLMGWRLTRGSRRSAVTRLGLATAGLALSLASTAAASPLQEWRARVAAYDRAGAAFAQGVFADDIVLGVYPFPSLIHDALNFMQDHRLGPFSSRMADLYRPPLNAVGRQPPTALTLCAEHQDVTRIVGPHWAEIVGWAFERDNPKDDGWVVAFDDAARVIGFARQGVDRPDVAASYHLSRPMVGYRLAVNLAGRAPDAATGITLVLIPSDNRGQPCRAMSKVEEP